MVAVPNEKIEGAVESAMESLRDEEQERVSIGIEVKHENVQMAGFVSHKVGSFSECGRIFRLTFSGLAQANSPSKNSSIRDEN